ncbi:SDR family oxidoreductase [Actinomarinicola tropica]|uniref:SDR family NAD(P)-dependent oxidoreductase n=1 Tax=Actinomarinicola tropica TaxID=2789776 RepID=A0A5Q2RIS5_9ACTN|nr:SDR family oxidoreductase [Actinomarinicola tropica]QGG94782.1 SDR family NAD(P)-dependent oxidoreductase [Actinomarinicola tropica]
MDLRDRIVVITGAAHGIGAALARRFAAEGARALVLGDLDEDALGRVADDLGAGAAEVVTRRCDVAREDDVADLVAAAEAIGPVDLVCSNAGIGIAGGVEVPDDDWRRIIDINVMAHVYAARAALPAMIERGEGYLLNTASAAGLLTQIGSAPYAVTKHAAVALAEWMAVTHGDQGIRVSVLCPQAVRTNMTAGSEGGGVAGVDGMMEPEEVADAVVAGLAEESFLILPHPEVAEYVRRKATDHDRWLAGMRRLQARYTQPL